MYVQYKANVSENQVDTLKDAIRLKKGATLCFPKGGITVITSCYSPQCRFAFSPLIGLFCSRTLNSKINALHYRALKLVYQDEKSSFDELLIKDKSVSVHQL